MTEKSNLHTQQVSKLKECLFVASKIWRELSVQRQAAAPTVCFSKRESKGEIVYCVVLWLLWLRNYNNNKKECFSPCQY